MQRRYSMHLFLLLFLLDSTNSVIADIDYEDPYCYTNSYSSPFDKFSFRQLDERFATGEGHHFYGCTVVIRLDYQTRVLRLDYTPTAHFDITDHRHTLLQKNQVLIQIILSMFINRDDRQTNTLRITYICSTSSDCTRSYIEHLFSEWHRQSIFASKQSDIWINALKEELLPPLANNRTDLSYECWSTTSHPVTCKTNIRTCRVTKTTRSEISSRCHAATDVDQASLIIETTLSASEDSTAFLWNLYETYSEEYLCSHSLCNSPNTTRVVFDLTKNYYDPTVYTHGSLDNARETTTTTDQIRTTSTRKSPMSPRGRNESFLCSRILSHIKGDFQKNSLVLDRLKDEYQGVEREYMHADLCLLTVTLEYTHYSITMDFDGINHDDQTLHIPSVSIHDHINLHDQSVVHQIIYICSFALCNEMFFLSRAFKQFLSSRADVDEYTNLLKYLRITLYDEADLTVNCYDTKLNFTRCEDGACCASGNIKTGSSFTGYCRREQDSNKKYYVHVEKKISPLSRKHRTDDYQLTYTCNQNRRRICNNLTSFKDVHERIPITYYGLRDLVQLAKHNIFNNSNREKTSTTSPRKTLTSKQYLTKTTTTNTDYTTISDRANRNGYIFELWISFSIILFSSVFL